MTTTTLMALRDTGRFERSDDTTIRPWFTADWRDAVFVHCAIDPAILQPQVPYELDLWDGQAWVSLVAFTQHRLRPAIGGRFAAALMWPVATHAFLNLRTYVRAGGHRGICFLAEWIPNRLARLIGPRLYGLPFHLARLDYRAMRRDVVDHAEALRFTAIERAEFHSAASATLDQFLLERYTAFTCREGRGRMFQIRHKPWTWRRCDVAVEDDGLIRSFAPWFALARPVCAHASAGVFDVEIGGPKRVPTTFDPARAPASTWTKWTPLIVLPVAALLLRNQVQAWTFMWLLALAVYFGCKWATWRDARVLARRAGWQRSLGYLFAWPGMDARAFLDPNQRPNFACGFAAFAGALARTCAGLLLLFAIPRYVPDAFLGGWGGMLGLILLLHFGFFDLLALAWQAFGVRAEPIMRSPTRARNLAEFWGVRWNRAFHDLAREWIFRPLHRRTGPVVASFVVFLTSGLVHDAIISLPAGAGFGLPTFYFLVQFLGIRVERTRWGRRHLRGVAGRLFAVAMTTLPLPLLFHPPFVGRVIVPFLRAIASL
ncbi:MAG TPA: DUF2071 domain-containing protein [Tepidisphaeraceae bacterium]|jgi:alginate O-acetyltransferase complex protein AlgI